MTDESNSGQVSEGDVVQLDPEQHTHHDGFWAGAFMLVEEVKPWGVCGFVKTTDGRAYYRAKTGTFAVVGAATWVAK